MHVYRVYGHVSDVLMFIQRHPTLHGSSVQYRAVVDVSCSMAVVVSLC